MEIVILLVLLILNGWFSMSEISLISAKRIRLKQDAEKGDIAAKKALKLSEKPENFLSTVQIGITLISILTGIFSGDSIKDNMLEFFKGYGIDKGVPNYEYYVIFSTVATVLFITYLSLIIGELVPKRIGLSNPEKFAKIVAIPMTYITKLAHPFVRFLSFSSGLILNLLNLKHNNEGFVTEEEIKAMIEEGTQSGTIDEIEQEIVENVFLLSDRPISSLMTHRSDLVWFEVEETIEDCKIKIREEQHSMYPVCRDDLDNVMGIVKVRDMFLCPADTKIESIVQKTLFVPEHNSAYQVLERFKSDKTQCAFIVDEFGNFLGMVTLRDIMDALVGDLPDDDHPDYMITSRDDGTWWVDGRVPFVDFIEYFDISKTYIEDAEDRYTTVAGLCLDVLQKIPKQGDTFEWNGFKIEIADMDSARVDKLLVQKSETTT